MSVSSVIAANNTSTSSTSSSSSTSMDPAAVQDRFLKLLVAQLTNQDPMNPMDNAQMTTQIAQINTVTGIQNLNNTMKTMAEQFSSLQVMQGSTMVGRNVLIEGSSLYRDGTTTKGKGSFDLADQAGKVKVEIVTPGGQVVGTVNMGELDSGRHSFEYDVGSYSGALNFRVVATNGKDEVKATTLQQDKIVSAGAQDGTLTLQLSKGGSVAYGKIKAIL